MRTLYALIISIGLAYSGCTFASESDDFVGTWLLDAIEVRDSSGHWVASIDPSVGPNPIGYITYDTSGYVSVQVMSSNRPALSLPQQSATTLEKSEAFQSYVAYFGTYEVDEIEDIVTHHTIGNLVPNRSGGDATRPYIFEGDTLTLFSNENRRLRWRKL